MLGGRGEFLTLRDFRVRIGFDEIWRSISREAKIDARISIEPQSPINALCRSLNAGGYIRCKPLGRPIHDADALLIVGFVLDLLGRDVAAAHRAELQFPYRKSLQPIVAKHADIQLSSFDELFCNGCCFDPLMDESDAL